MTDWFAKNKSSIIKNSFLLPILLVVIMSISHVVTWYSIGNPYSWAIYLSVAIEIFALASVSASTLNIGKGSIWILFTIVTLIQVVGNVFYEYQFINETGEIFKSWTEILAPITEDWTAIDHKRLLALVQGGTLPIMSLTALHFYIEANNKDNVKVKEEVKEETEEAAPDFTVDDIPLEFEEEEDFDDVIPEEVLNDIAESYDEDYEHKLDRLVTSDDVEDEEDRVYDPNPKIARRQRAEIAKATEDKKNNQQS